MRKTMMRNTSQVKVSGPSAETDPSISSPTTAETMRKTMSNRLRVRCRTFVWSFAMSVSLWAVSWEFLTSAMGLFRR